MLRPDGLLGDVVLVGRARDLATSEAGEAAVVGEAGFLARVAFIADRTIAGIATSPPEPGAAALVGVKASSGFRAELDRALPAHRETRSLLYLLLDDLPVAALVSGYAIGAGGMRMPARRLSFHPDLCAGWRTGGTMLVGIEKEGHIPSATGPPAPSLARGDDPLAWHATPPLPPHSMRRHRRLDLRFDSGAAHRAEGHDCRVASQRRAASGADDPDSRVASRRRAARSPSFLVDVLFRDSYVDADGCETIVHEYAVRAAIDPSSLRVEDVEAEARVLPWVECEAAAASAKRVVGSPIAGLRPQVRAELTGPSTCTHLNDTLRSLEDVAALAAWLRESEVQESA